MPNTGMTPEEIRRYMQGIGLQDFEQGNVPSGLLDPATGQANPNAVFNPNTGEFMGYIEQVPVSNATQPMSDLDAARIAAMQANAGGMAGMTGGNNLGGAISNQDARFIEQNMANSGNQIIDQSRFNLSALLKRLGMQ